MRLSYLSHNILQEVDEADGSLLVPVCSGGITTKVSLSSNKTVDVYVTDYFSFIVYQDFVHHNDKLKTLKIPLLRLEKSKKEVLKADFQIRHQKPTVPSGAIG